MVPFPYVFVKEVAYYLRFFNAAIADWFLRTIGIPVFREAYFLHLPNITLEVADLCSGISSVFALFALGTLYAYFLPIRSTMKILVVCSTIPFAVLVNLLRIILTSALAYFIGPQVLNFLVHEFTGMITFFIALGLFVSLGEYLHRKYIGLDKRNRSTTWLTPRESIFSETIQSSGAGAGYKKMAFLFACAMFILAHFSFSRLDNPKRIGLKSQLETLSQRLGPFSISNRSWPHPYRDRNAEYELSRMYEAEQQGLLEFYVGYASQQGDDNRLSSPRLKFVYGWNDLWAEAAKVEVDESRFIDGMWMLTQNGTQKRLVLYWYQTDGDTFGNEMSYRIARVKQLLLTGQSNAAIIRIAVPVGEDEDVEQGKKKAAEFVRHLYPEIAKLLPI
jgi:EpsI family protein